MKAARQGVYWEGLGTLILRGWLILILRGWLILVVLCYRRIEHTVRGYLMLPARMQRTRCTFLKLPSLTGRQVPEGAQGVPAARMHERYG